MDDGGVKFDEGKPMISLIPSEFIEGCATALTFGASKYGKHNFRKGMAWTRLMDSMQRHYLAILRNEDIDPESKLPHIDHIAANVAMLKYMMEHFPEKDDRHKNYLFSIDASI